MKNVLWDKNDPPKSGYYLATWIRGGIPVVSELWFNPDAIVKWWSTRRYMGERPNHPMDGAIKQGVVAWAYLPEPFVLV